MKRLQIVLITLVLIGGLFYAGRKLTIHALASIDLNVKPFTATVTHYAVKDGVEVVTTKETIARTRSGARVHVGITYSPNGAILPMRKIDMPDGFVATVSDSLKAKVTGHRPDVTLASSKKQILNQPADCVEKAPPAMKTVEKLEGEEVLFGQRVSRISVTQNGYRVTHWRTPDFNCQPVQVLVEENVNGKWQVKAGYRLTSFVEGDPNPELFSGYASYREMPPSGLVQEYMKQQTGQALPPNKTATDQLKAMDQKYQSFNK